MTHDESLTEVFQLVHHKIRAEILVTLAEHQREHPRHPSVQFSELRQRIGHDDPGNFNYHLQRLSGRLIERTDDGYRLSQVGHRFVVALRSTQYDPAVKQTFTDATPPCVICQSPSAVIYEDGQLKIRCSNDHEARLNGGVNLFESVPINVAINIALRRNLFDLTSFIDGICPHCDGEAKGGLERRPSAQIPVQYEATCQRCGEFVQSTVAGCVLFHPAVVSFFHHHTVDVFQATSDVLADVQTTRLLNDNPAVAQTIFCVDGAEMAVTVDHDGRVADVQVGS